MPIRIIHIGTGARGRHWLEIVRDYPDASAVAYVDKDPKALDEARKLAGNANAGFFTDLPKALREVSADAALIATPSALHAEHALHALESGLAVLTEKPFAMNLSEAREVIHKAETLGKHVIVAENYRFFAAERTVRQWIADDRLGRIATVTCVDRRNQPPSTQGPWVATIAYPQLAEIAVHHFDSFRYLFGRNPLNIMTRTYNPPGSHYQNGAATEALIEMEENLSILYFGTLTSHRYEYSLWIEGEKGSLWTDRKRVWWRKKGARFFVPVKLVTVPKGDELRYPRAGTTSILNQLRDAILHNKEAETSGRDNFWTLAMVEAAKTSAQENRRVSIAEVAEGLSPTPVAGRNGDRHETHSTDHLTVPAPFSASLKKSRPRSRVMVIGWDAADVQLIEQWCAEGLLPNIGRMKARGIWARMQTTAEVVHVSAWPSIFTGTTPDKHGLYHAYVMCPGQQSPLRPRPDQSPVPFLWKHLSDQGKRCVIMDAFLTCPLENFNGAQIVDWGSWSKFWEPTILPASLKNEIEKKFGPYPAEDHSRIGMTPLDDSEGFYRRLLEAVSKKADVVKWLMEREEWDLFLVVFGESHPIGHYFWHCQDPSHPAHASATMDKLRHALRDVYVALDKALGQIMECVDERTTVLLVSGDGMGPNYSGSHILSDLLARMGVFNNSQLVNRNGSGDKAGSGASAKKNKTDLLNMARQMIPTSLRARVAKSLFPRSLNEKLSLKWKTAGIAWNQTRAFLIENANEGYIRINLKGREPQGIVEPGREYNELCEEIRLTCEQMINPINGRRAARTVYKTDDLYRGPRRSHMPDIIINWDEEAQVTTELLTEKYGLARSKYAAWSISPYYTGNHRADAFAVVTGPGVAEGKTVEGTSILDLAPTILSRLGVEPSAHMDGRILSELGERNDSGSEPQAGALEKANFVTCARLPD
jgi:predicted dehydrogenase/predicted AlkP superfamily phosphohydrolase/phosphomutase